MSNLSNLLKLLLNANFDFVLIGGFAGVVHGSTLVTRDLDICMDLTEKNILELRSILKTYKPFHRMTPQKLSFLQHPKKLTSIQNLYLSTELGVLDVLSSVKGLGCFDEVQMQSESIQIFDLSCNILTKEALIKAKKALGRDKDLAMVKELE